MDSSSDDGVDLALVIICDALVLSSSVPVYRIGRDILLFRSCSVGILNKRIKIRKKLDK